MEGWKSDMAANSEMAMFFSFGGELVLGEGKTLRSMKRRSR